MYYNVLNPPPLLMSIYTISSFWVLLIILQFHIYIFVYSYILVRQIIVNGESVHSTNIHIDTDKFPFKLEQCQIKLSGMMEMFSICIAQYCTYRPHEAIEHLK